jgi:hypothetical protein
MPQKKKHPNLQTSIFRLSYIHFFYIFAFVISIIIYDASQLITPDAVWHRWKLAAGMLIISTMVWYLAHIKEKSHTFQKGLVAVLVIADIVFASLLVYADRGMASVAIVLYAIPIAASAILLSRSAVMATTLFCVAAYSTSVVKYFGDFFNEGYKVQLYSTIGFYSAVFFVFAWLLGTLIQRKSNK